MLRAISHERASRGWRGGCGRSANVSYHGVRSRWTSAGLPDRNEVPPSPRRPRRHHRRHHGSDARGQAAARAARAARRARRHAAAGGVPAVARAVCRHGRRRVRRRDRGRLRPEAQCHHRARRPHRRERAGRFRARRFAAHGAARARRLRLPARDPAGSQPAARPGSPGPPEPPARLVGNVHAHRHRAGFAVRPVGDGDHRLAGMVVDRGCTDRGDGDLDRARRAAGSRAPARRGRARRQLRRRTPGGSAGCA